MLLLNTRFFQIQRHPGDVAENRDFISLSHEMEIPMAEIARNVGYVDQLSLRQFKRWNQRIRFIDFINVPIFPVPIFPSQGKFISIQVAFVEHRTHVLP